MKRQASIALFLFSLITCGPRTLAADAPAPADPLILTVTLGTKDAPEVTPTVHGLMRQNFSIDWSLVAPGPTEGQDALYLFTSVVRAENIQGETPVLAYLDLADGKLREIYPGSKIKTREHAAALELTATAGRKDELMTEGETASPEMTTSWVWGRAISGARASKNSLFLGTEALETVKPMLLRYLPREGVFEELTALSVPAVGMVFVRGALWYITRDGGLFTYDDMGGVESKGRLPKTAAPVSGLFADSAGFLYTRSGEVPYKLLAMEIAGGGVKTKPLLADKQIESALFHESVPAPWCELVVKEGEHFHTETYLLKGGQAVPVQGKPDESALVAERGYELKTDFNEEPLEAAVRRKGGDWKHYPIVFSKTGRDNLKELCPGPDGKYLYGAGWPVSWIWRFDPETGRFTILGRHYVFYEMLPWKDELWVCGYWGIKLLRWHPEEPWTFDYPRHYEKKTYPGNTSPWGDQGVSNPRLVCKFRYLKQMNTRRPGGMALGPDGRVYVGGRTPAVEYFNSRFGGGLNWYDPETETIGQIRDPFLHHSVRDVCRAGDRYIAAVASQYICMYEPLPADFSPGKFVLYDTKAQQVAVDISPLGAALSYAEEGVTGRVVVAGANAGKYAGEGVASALFIFDTAQKRVTHVIRVPFKVVWSEYNVLPFLKGPDSKVYFYGADADGVALFRIDSVSGKVEPVLRAKGITDEAVITNRGATFAFFKNRVYFGVHALVSLPLETVVGKP